MPVNAIACTPDTPCEKVSLLGVEVSELRHIVKESSKKIDNLVQDTKDNREVDQNSRKTAREIQKREIKEATDYIKKVHVTIKGDGTDFNPGIEGKVTEHSTILKKVDKFMDDYYYNKEEHDRVKELAHQVAKETAVPRWFARQASKVDKWAIIIILTILVFWSVGRLSPWDAVRKVFNIDAPIIRKSSAPSQGKEPR